MADNGTPAVVLEIPGMTPRWGQLTYASIDRANDTGGGWQVMDTSGALSDGEIEALTQRIVTRFDPDMPLEAFPNAAELECLPRRLTYICDDRGQGTYWHSTMAGRDSTGRPGNVFSHVVLDRATAERSPAIRPIEIWRSPGLLCPFGPEQVSLAALPEVDHPVFGAVMGRQAVLDFLFDPAQWRVGVLSALLDAVSGALKEGPPVVLVTGSTDTAALWIAAVSSLAPASWIRRMNFSVYERAAGLGAVFERGVHLVCVPRADAAGLSDQSGFILLDEQEMPDLGEVGGRPHQTHAGSPILATNWSALAQAALVDPATFSTATSTMDDVAARIGDCGREPSWALAIAALRLPDLFADYQAEAAAIMARHSPDSMEEDDELMQLARERVQQTSGGSAEEAWAELEQDEASRLIRTVLVETYLRCALQDHKWLARPGAIPLPTDYRTEGGTPELRQVARSAILSLQRRFSEENSPEFPSTALRILDFIHSNGLADTRETPAGILEDAITEIIERVVFQVVDDDQRSKELVQETGTLASDVLCRKVLAAVQNSVRFASQPAGKRIPPAFCDWLLGAMAPSGLSDLLLDPHSAIAPLAAEQAIWLCRNGLGHRDGARVVAAAGLLEPAQEDYVDPVLGQIFVQHPPWRAAELLYLEQKFPSEMPGGFFLSALLREEWSQSLEDLIRVVVDQRESIVFDSPEVRFALLRRTAQQPWMAASADDARKKAAWILSTVAEAVSALQGRLEPLEFRALVLKAAVITVASPQGFSSLGRETQNLISGYLADPADGVSEVLQSWVDDRVLGRRELEELTRLAIETAPGYPAAENAPGSFLSGAMGFDGSERVRLLEVPIRHALRTGQADPTVMCDSILAKNWNQTFNAGSERVVEKQYEEREKFSRDWWKKLRQETGPVQDKLKPVRFGGFMSAIRKDR